MSSSLDPNPSAGPATNVTLRPRLRALMNGSELPNVSQTSVTKTNYAKGDSFSLTVTIDPRQTSSTWFDPTAVPPADIEIRIQAGFLPQGATEGALTWTDLITGIVDSVDYTPARGALKIAGRDYLGKLLDVQVVDGWLNKRSDEVLVLLIEAAGLTPDVQVTGSVTGQYYQIGHKRSALTANHRFNNSYDLARFLCSAEGWDLWADGKTIRVRKTLSDDSAPFPVVYQPPGSATYPQVGVANLNLQRSLLLARGTVVRVLSWHSRQRKTVDVRWPVTGSTGSSGTNSAASKGTLHTFKRPNLDNTRALALAHQLYDLIVAHQRTVTVSMPGELTLSPRQVVRLSGTGTTWDGPLRIDSITRDIDMAGGFQQTVVLRNRDITEDEDQE